MSATDPSVSDRYRKVSMLVLPGAGVLVALGVLFLLVAENRLVGSVLLAVGVLDTFVALALRRSAATTERRTNNAARPMIEEQ